MSDKVFLDTNIFVYSFDASSPAKQKRAQALIAEALTTGCGFISYQVVQEFLNVATRKFRKPIKQADNRRYLDSVLMPLCEVFPSATLYRDALEVQSMTEYSWYDSLIVACALAAGCDVLYSEDLQAGRLIRDLVIVNPFA